MKKQSEVSQRQRQLSEEYKKDPSLAFITDSSEVIGLNLHDPFKTSVSISADLQIPFTIGIHRAVGGNHDYPNPGDVLCAALASCFESTMRMISHRLNIDLSETRVKASAQVDVRGTLRIDNSIPVGFQFMQLEVVALSKDSNPRMMETLLRATEHSCIIYQTLKQCLPITLTSNLDPVSPSRL